MRKGWLHNIVYIVPHYSCFIGTLLKLEKQRQKDYRLRYFVTIVSISFFCANFFKALKH